MRNGIMILLLIIAQAPVARSQTDSIAGSGMFEDSTLYYYNSFQYQKLIELGKKGLKYHEDYYYLDYRMAVAEQQMGRYYLSNYYAARGLKLNSGDPSLYSIIAFNAYMAGKTEEYHFAAVNAGQSYDTIRRTSAFQPVQFIYSEAALKKTNVTNIGNFSYYHAGLQSALSKRLFLYQGYTVIRQSVYWGDIQQWQYYGKLIMLLSVKTKVSGAFHYLNTGTTDKLETPPTLKATDNYVALISAEHFFKFINLKANAALVNIGNSIFYQYGFNTSYVPFGNTSLMMGLDIQVQEMNGSQKVFIKPEMTLKVHRNAWFALQYFVVNGYNSIESDAFLVNNSGDKTKDRVQFLLNYRLNDHFSFYGIYQYVRKVEYFYNTDYTFNTFLFGLKLSL